MSGYETGKCFVYLNPEAPRERRTVCVLGSPRGGTSMISGLLRLLGVYMGEKLDEDNNEDTDFISHQGRRDIFEEAQFAAEKQQYLSGLLPVIENRRRQYPVWGWKDPLSIYYIDDVKQHLENPFYIAIFRDSLAVTLGEMAKNNNLPRAPLKLNSQVYQRIADFSADGETPVLCISYEKALQNSGELVRQLAKCLGIDINPQEVRTLSAYIEPNRNTGRTMVNTERNDALQRLKSVSPVFRDFEYYTRSVTSLALQAPRGTGNLADYTQRYASEKELFDELVRLMQREQYDDAQLQLGLMAALYTHTFGVAPHDVAAICSSHYQPGQLPHYLVHHYFFSAILNLIHRRDYEVSLEHFRRCFELALYYIGQNVGDKEDIASNYLWSAKYHEGYTLKQMERRQEASMVKLFLVSLHEALQHSEKIHEVNPLASYLNDGLYQMAVRELP
jgi:tetratricopeptide (TPR) repeat protein